MRFSSFIKGAAIPALALGLLAGCASTGGSSPTITLAAVQAEGNALVAALQAGVAIYVAAPSTTPAEAATVEADMKTVVSENAALQAISPTATSIQVVEAVVNNVVEVVDAMPIDPATKTGIEAALAILNTFISEQQAIANTPPAPVAAPVKIQAPRVL